MGIRPVMQRTTTLTDKVHLSFAITHMDARADRRAWVSEMIRKMGGPSAINREVLRWQVTKDHGQGIWANQYRSWASGTLVTGATHHLVLEDDIALCSDFLEGVKVALAAAPDCPVSFYANRLTIDEARATGGSWARIDDQMGSGAQALAMPTSLVRDFLQWDRANLRPEAFAYGSRLVIWSLYNRVPVLCTVPSLVEHVGAGESTIGYSNRKRVARWFIGESQSALSVDWSKGVENPPKASVKSVSWPGFRQFWKQPPESIYGR